MVVAVVLSGIALAVAASLGGASYAADAATSLAHTVNGDGGHIETADDIVNEGAGIYLIQATPDRQTIHRGSVGRAVVEMVPGAVYRYDVMLQANAPIGIRVATSSHRLSPGAKAAVIISVSDSASSGPQTVTFTATAPGGASRIAQITVVVP